MATLRASAMGEFRLVAFSGFLRYHFPLGVTLLPFHPATAAFLLLASLRFHRLLPADRAAVFAVARAAAVRRLVDDFRCLAAGIAARVNSRRLTAGRILIHQFALRVGFPIPSMYA